MRSLLSASAAFALCLVAAPAWAQAISDERANAMLDELSTTAFGFCTDSDEAELRPPMDQYNACQTALTELAETRRKNPKATPGQKEVYAFLEGAIEMGHTLSMLRVDEAPTTRVCVNIEKQWILASQADPKVVGEGMRDAQASTRAALRPLVKLCRELFPAPAGATAV